MKLNIKRAIQNYKRQTIGFIKNNPIESVISCILIMTIGVMIISVGLNQVIDAIIAFKPGIDPGPAFNELTSNVLFGVLISIASLPLFLIGNLLAESHKFGIISAGILGIVALYFPLTNTLVEIGIFVTMISMISAILGFIGRKKTNVKRRDSPIATEKIVKFTTMFFALIAVAILFSFLLYIGIRGIKYFTPELLISPWENTEEASNRLYAKLLDEVGLLDDIAIKIPKVLTYLEEPVGGVFNHIIGTLLLVGLCGLISSPVGLGAGIYLSEYASENKVTNIIRLFITTLAGVPSIVIGLVGYAFFVFNLGWGYSLLGGSLSLMFMILPWIVSTAEESIKVVPQSYREAALALGATKWQSIRHAVISAASPGIITGILLGIGKAMGETAVVLFTAGREGTSEFIVDFSLTTGAVPTLPVWIYDTASFMGDAPWASMSNWEARNFALSGALVLIIMFLIISVIALILRNYFSKKLGANI